MMSKQGLIAWWWPWHQRLGLFSAVVILLWGLSGTLHPVMSWLSPRANPKPPAAVLPSTAPLQDPATILAQHGIKQFAALSLLRTEAGAHFRVLLEPQTAPRWFNAANGVETRGADAAYAQNLARHFANKPTTRIHNMRWVDQFDAAYPEVNRILPVWEVGFDDGTLAYIDTQLGRVVTLANPSRRYLSQLFRWGHNFAFLENWPLLQKTVLSAGLLAVFLSAASGLYLFFALRHKAKARGKKRPVWSWHRRIGLAVAVAALLWVISGFWHVWVPQAVPPQVPGGRFSSEVLQAEGWRGVQSAHAAHLVFLPQQVLWYVPPSTQSRSPEHQHHQHHSAATPEPPPATGTAFDSRSGQRIDAAEAYITRQKLEGITSAPIVRLHPVQRFGGEYGFIFKRLPVMQAELNNGENIYIEAATATVAAHIQPHMAWEGWSFAYLHKWHWLDANKMLRDVLMMLFALATVTTGMLGLWLYGKRLRQRG